MYDRKDGTVIIVLFGGIIESIKELLYPRRCVVCDRPPGYGRMICPGCIGKLRVVRGPVCCKCGKPLRDESEELCKDCKRSKHFFTKGRSVYEYKSIRKSVYRFKYSGRSEYADYYGKAMAHYLGDTIREWNPDVIIPVPLHKKKLAKRGYNQSALLASGLARELGIPFAENLVKRTKNTIPMKELDAHQRQINLKNAFIVALNDVKLDTIVVVDDIYTTGSTIDAVAAVLKDAGARDVYFVCLSSGASM